MTYEEYLDNKKWYQIEGKELLLTEKHACLFFSPGKGKTYPVIEAMQEVDKKKGGNANILIISSADAIRKMWQVDIVPQKILPKNTFLVTDRTAIGDMSEVLLRRKWDIILVDECHIIKAHNSKIHKLVLRLCKNVEYAWGLTGTPRGNNDIDIWCQLQALNVAGQGKFSYTAWTRAYCEFDVGYSQHGKFQKPTKIKEKYNESWQKMLSKYCMFVDYEDDDYMPRLEVQTLEIPYTKTKEYEDAFQGIISVGDFATTTEKVVAINKAQQVCNGYIYLPDKTIHRYHQNNKLRYLDDLRDYRCVIVYKYIADYEDLMGYYSSTVATDDINAFKNGDYEILLLQCGNCKSFNLQDYCHQIIFYTMDYSFIKYKQMIHRCWRLGQNVDTEVLVLIHKGTVEENIWRAVRTKKEMHDLYMSITHMTEE